MKHVARPVSARLLIRLASNQTQLERCLCCPARLIHRVRRRSFSRRHLFIPAGMVTKGKNASRERVGASEGRDTSPPAPVNTGPASRSWEGDTSHPRSPQYGDATTVHERRKSRPGPPGARVGASDARILLTHPRTVGSAAAGWDVSPSRDRLAGPVLTRAGGTCPSPRSPRRAHGWHPCP